MIEDIAQNVNPIIQAMIATANLQKQGQQQDIEKERNKNEAAARQEGLKQAQKALEYQHEHNLSQLEVQRMQAEAQIRSEHATELLKHQQFVHAGGDYKSVLDQMAPGLSKTLSGGAGVSQAQQNPPMQQPQQQPEQNFSPVQGFSPVQQPQQQDVPQNPFGSADEAAAIQARAAGLKTAAESNAAVPAQLQVLGAQAANARTLQDARLASEKVLQDSRLEVEQKLTNLHINSAETIAKLSRSSAERISAATNATHLQAMGMDPNTNKGMVQSMYLGALTGDYKLNPSVNPLERVVYDQVQQSGAHLVDPKEALGLREAQKLVPLFDKLDAFAKQFPTSTSGAWAQGHTVGLANTLGIPTDLQNKINIINSQAMNVGKATEGITGRPLAQQMKLDLDSLATPGITRSQFQDRINNLRQNYVNNQDNVFFSGMPNFQKDLIKQKYGLVPIASQSPQSGQKSYERTAIGAGGHRIGLSSGKWYDVQTGEEMK